MKYLRPILKKIPILILLGAFGISSLLVAARPQPTVAIFGVGDLVYDGANWLEKVFSYVEQQTQYISQLSTQFSTDEVYLKDYIGDPLAWSIAKALLRSTTNDLIRTVSQGTYNAITGRSSGPMFVTNLSYNLKNNVETPLEEDVTRGITSDAKKAGTPFLSKAAEEVHNNFLRSTSDKGYYSTHKSTLSIKNPSKFVEGDFSQGGVDGLLSMVGNPSNNPYGSYYSVKNYLQTNTARAVSSRVSELGYGGGFLSSPGVPGSVIKAQLNKDLGSGVSSLVAAHTIGEVISSLAANLANHIIGGTKNGLIGFAKSPDSGKYVNTNPPNGSAGMAKILTSKIDSSEKTLAGYSAEWSTIVNSAKNASSTLTTLINYKPPTTGSSTQQYATCVSNYKTLQSAAVAVSTKVQAIINKGNEAITSATSAKQKLEAIRTEITAAVKSNSTTELQKASVALQDLTNPSDGVMPSPSDVVYAQTQSISTNASGGGASTVTSSGPNKLTVTGGTVVDRMPVLAKNAAAALAKIKVCFENASSSSGGSGG